SQAPPALLVLGDVVADRPPRDGRDGALLRVGDAAKRGEALGRDADPESDAAVRICLHGSRLPAPGLRLRAISRRRKIGQWPTGCRRAMPPCSAGSPRSGSTQARPGSLVGAGPG